MRKRSYCLHLILIALSILMLFMFASCYLFSGYKTFTVNKGIAHFSYDYPVSYRVHFVDVREALGYIDVRMEGKRLDAEGERIRIDLFINSISASYPTSKDEMEHDMAFPRDWLDEYSILEQGEIVIDDIVGYQYTYSGIVPAGYDEHSGAYDSRPIVRKQVFLYHEGISWKFDVSSHQNWADIAIADFDNILQTFEILD